MPTIQASPQSLAPGQTTTVTGSGFPPGSTLLVELFSDPVLLGTTVADATGAFRISVTVPLGTSPGLHTLRVSGAGGAVVAETTLTITALTVAQFTSGSLSRTGTDIRGPVGFALALVVVGFALVGVSWDGRRPGFSVSRRPPWPARRRWWL